MIYPGGKNLAGTYQRIINQIPPHSFYCEPFCGSAAIAEVDAPGTTGVSAGRGPVVAGHHVPMVDGKAAVTGSRGGAGPRTIPAKRPVRTSPAD